MRQWTDSGQNELFFIQLDINFQSRKMLILLNEKAVKRGWKSERGHNLHMMPYRGLFLLILLFLRGIISSLVYYWFTDIRFNTGRVSEWKRRREVFEMKFSLLFCCLHCSTWKKKNLPLLLCILDALWPGRKLIVENCVDTFSCDQTNDRASLFRDFKTTMVEKPKIIDLRCEVW